MAGKHVRGASAQQALEKAVRNAILVSFVAEAVALTTGRVRWPSILLVIVCVSYLVEAADKWRAVRADDEEAELNAILDAEDELLQAA